MIGMLIMVTIVVVLGLLAIRFGADTRDGQDWRDRPGEWRPRSGQPGGSPFRTPVSPR